MSSARAAEVAVGITQMPFRSARRYERRLQSHSTPTTNPPIISHVAGVAWLNQSRMEYDRSCMDDLRDTVPYSRRD
jgi:hypothetical protein